jgi:hypothetical protein
MLINCDVAPPYLVPLATGILAKKMTQRGISTLQISNSDRQMSVEHGAEMRLCSGMLSICRCLLTTAIAVHRGYGTLNP